MFCLTLGQKKRARSVVSVKNAVIFTKRNYTVVCL